MQLFKRWSKSPDNVLWKWNSRQGQSCPCALPDAEIKGMEMGCLDPGAPGTHMHVVDAIATYCPSVVAEIILNSRVPHLKSRRGERKPALSIRWGTPIRSSDTRFCKNTRTSRCYTSQSNSCLNMSTQSFII